MTSITLPVLFNSTAISIHATTKKEKTKSKENEKEFSFH